MPSHQSHVGTLPRRSTVLVRDAGLGDRHAMREVLEAAFAPFARVLPTTLFSRYLADVLDLDCHARHGALLVAEIEGRIVGSGAFYHDIASQRMGWPNGWAGGRGLAVHPDARGRGAARALLAECERRAHSLGARVFAFHTATFMTEAIALYERLGYRRAPQFDLDLGAHFGYAGSEAMRSIAYSRDVHDGHHR